MVRQGAIQNWNLRDKLRVIGGWLRWLTWSFGQMNPLYIVRVLVFIGLFMIPAAVLAKRIPAPVVAPIVYQGVRYTVPNDKGTKAYVVASDAITGKELWKQTIFRKCICRFVEHDVQWVFIKQMRLDASA